MTRGRGRPAAGSRAVVAMDLAVVAWVVASALSTLTSVSPRLSLLGEIEQREGLLTTLALAGLYAGARRSHVGAAAARRTLNVLLACAVIAAAYAMIQFAGLDPLVWANATTYPSGAWSALRPSSTLGNPILLGALLAAALAVAAARLASGRGDPWRIAPGAVLLATAIAATLSRGAWLAAALGVLAAIAGALALRTPHAARRVGLTLAVAVLPAAAWSAIALRGAIAARIAEAAHAGATSGAARMEIARGALALWRAHRWLGTGPDTFGLTFPSVQTAALWRDEWIGVPVHAHSAALQILTTCGVAGTLAGLMWLIALGFVIAIAWRRATDHRAEIVAIGSACVSLVIAGAFNPVGLAGAAVFVTLAAMVAACTREPVEARPPARTPAIAAAIGLVVLAVLAAGAVREMSALAAAGRARDTLTDSVAADPRDRATRAAESVRAAKRAVALDPIDDELLRLECDSRVALAGAALANRDLAAAKSAALAAEVAGGGAMRREPRRASNVQRLANALAMRARAVFADTTGDAHASLASLASLMADEADAAFVQAERLAPKDALILVDQTRAQLELARAEGALATARRIVAMYPGAATGHALEAAALMSLGRRGETRAALRRALAARWEDGAESQRSAAEAMLRALGPADSTR